MFKALIKLFKAENLLAQANDQVIEMLKEDLSLFRDSIKLLWTEEGVSIEEIRERDRQINRHVRDVRKKVLTHLAFSGSSGMETVLALISIVRDIERIGDHTKDIGYLATDFPGKFKAGEFENGLKKFENLLIERIQTLIDIFETGDDIREKAGRLTRSHLEVNSQYREMILSLITKEDVSLTPSQSAILALYMRYLRRVEGHIFNIASAEVNPFHRIGFKKKKKKAK
jgi:phosphate uptake regulator